MRLSPEKMTWLDHFLYHSLALIQNNMPSRFGKFIAIYYPDARIRKLYSHYIGVKMGEGTYANLGMKVVPNKHNVCVYIGENVSIAPNVTLICECSANNGKEINEIQYVKDVLTIQGDIVIEDEVWIGANVTIFPNVKIGKCSIIGAGSIVTSDVDHFSIYVGTPARKIRDLKSGKRVN